VSGVRGLQIGEEGHQELREHHYKSYQRIQDLLGYDMVIVPASSARSATCGYVKIATAGKDTTASTPTTTTPRQRYLPTNQMTAFNQLNDSKKTLEIEELEAFEVDHGYFAVVRTLRVCCSTSVYTGYSG